MSDEKKTPTAWSAHCLEFLQEIHPGYSKNREVKDVFIEFTREDDSGLIISHNFFRHLDTYYYSFALLFSKRPTVPLDHCLLSGSRFDRNRTISRQFADFGLKRGDPGYPGGVWSSGVWFKNTLGNLKPGMAIPETHLLPRYRAELKSGKERLVRLYERAGEMLESLPAGADVTGFETTYPEAMATIWDLRRREHYSLSAREIARGRDQSGGDAPSLTGFKVENLSLDEVVCDQAEVFLGERERMGEIVEIARRL